MVIHIDFNSDEAIYMQLHNQIIYGIATDALAEGDSLPSIRQLAEEIGVNMHTVNKAYAMLREEGFLKLDRRSGAIISIATREKEQEIQVLANRLEKVIAEAICKDVTREDLHEVIDYMYDRFSDNERNNQ